jgi:hypothetical protein
MAENVGIPEKCGFLLLSTDKMKFVIAIIEQEISEPKDKLHV